MTGFPRSPRTLKGGIVSIDPRTSAVLRVITLQYNPDSVSRTLQMQSAGEGGDQSEALRLKGPPVETIKIEAEWDIDRSARKGGARRSGGAARPAAAARGSRNARSIRPPRSSTRTTRWRRPARWRSCRWKRR